MKEVRLKNLKGAVLGDVQYKGFDGIWEEIVDYAFPKVCYGMQGIFYQQTRKVEKSVLQFQLVHPFFLTFPIEAYLKVAEL